MATFAQLDSDNIVLNTIKISNDEILDENGNENEELGIKRCKELFGEDTKWVQTWFSSPPPKRFRTAGPGMIYDRQYDVFVFPKLFPSWSLNTETYLWESPTPIPPKVIGYNYMWNEETLNWDKVKKNPEDIIPPEDAAPDGFEYFWNSESWEWDLKENPVDTETT